MGELFKRDVRRLILETARKKFLHFGLKKTTIEEISHELKISKKTLYEHFRSKQDIWNELVNIEAKLTAEYLKSYLPDDQPPLVRIEKLCGYYFRKQLQNQENSSGKDDEDDLLTQKRLREQSMNLTFPDLLAQLIDEARQTDAIRELDAKALAGLIQSVLDKAAKLCSEGTKVPMEELKGLVSSMLVKLG